MIVKVFRKGSIPYSKGSWNILKMRNAEECRSINQ